MQPAHRGRGIGEALLSGSRALAVERGCGRFEWSVLDWNERRDPLLPAHGRDGHARLAHLPHRRRGAGGVRATLIAMAGAARAVDRYDAIHAGLPLVGAGATSTSPRPAAGAGRGHAGRHRDPLGARGRAHGDRITYGELQRDANRLAHALRSLGVQRGDRVAIVMPQRFETAVAHIALHQLGAVAMPLSMLFGPDALEYRLQHSEAARGDRRRERASATCCGARRCARGWTR